MILLCACANHPIDVDRFGFESFSVHSKKLIAYTDESLVVPNFQREMSMLGW